jgi:hypothetical protein
MRDLKGDWRDLFNGFMVALDLRKMFLAFCGIIFTVFGIGAATAIIGNTIDPEFVQRPNGFLLHEIWATICQGWHVIYSGTPGHAADWKIYLPYSIFCVLATIVIWSYFGGAICRIAAYEIAKDGERIETARALKFASKKFWSFFWAPLICAIGFAFFFLCNFVGGLIGKLLDIIPYAGVIGAPLVSILLPLAVLSGFIMTLILLGTVAGSPLFAPAVAAEGTDSFDAVSRGFSYVYSRPWHYAWYQLVSGVYGYICIGFVILFAVTMCHVGIKAGAAGFDLFGVWQKDQYDHIADASWTMILSRKHQTQRYDWDPVTYGRHFPRRVVRDPLGVFVREPYGRLQNLSCRIVQPNWNWTVDKIGEETIGLEARPATETEKAQFQKRKKILERWDAIESKWAGEKDLKKKEEIQKASLAAIYKLGQDAMEQRVAMAGPIFEAAADIDPKYKGSDAGDQTVEEYLRRLGYTKTPDGTDWVPPEGRARGVRPSGADDFLTPAPTNPGGHKVATYVLTAWLIVILGLALGYPISYFFSQQTMIYYILRKKVDGIEMNEVYEETDDEERMPEPIPPPKPAEPSPKPEEGKSPEPPKG